MKQSLACISVIALAAACSSSSDLPAGPGAAAGSVGTAGMAGAAPSQGGAGSGAGGASAGGSAGGLAGASTAGAANGGSAGAGIAGSGNAGSAGTGLAGSGNAGSGNAGGGNAGSGGGMNASAFKCPAGPFQAPVLAGAKTTKVPGAPPADAFNKDAFTNVEGPVWIGDSLYFTEMTSANLPPARILKLAPGNVVSVVIPDAGANGLAVDGAGTLFAAVHKDGSISQVGLPGGTETPLVSRFGMPPVRFNSPNDLAIRSDGTIYFSDPNFQNTANPQGAERLYRITPAPTRTVSLATNAMDTAYFRPNGVTLSPDEQTLYVSGSGLRKYAVMADGTLGTGVSFVAGASGGDGMAVDCAGNLYVSGGTNSVKVFSSAGSQLGTIATDGGPTTNVAFGGADHKTLYVTSQGTEGSRGLHSIALTVPGFPY